MSSAKGPGAPAIQSHPQPARHPAPSGIPGVVGATELAVCSRGSIGRFPAQCGRRLAAHFRVFAAWSRLPRHYETDRQGSPGIDRRRLGWLNIHICPDDTERAYANAPLQSRIEHSIACGETPRFLFSNFLRPVVGTDFGSADAALLPALDPFISGLPEEHCLSCCLHSTSPQPKFSSLQRDLS